MITSPGLKDSKYLITFPKLKDTYLGYRTIKHNPLPTALQNIYIYYADSAMG